MLLLESNLLGTHWGQSGSDGLKVLSAPHVIVTEASMKASSVFILSTQLNVMLSPIRIGFPSQSILFRFFSSGGRGGFEQCVQTHWAVEMSGNVEVYSWFHWHWIFAMSVWVPSENCKTCPGCSHEYLKCFEKC